MARGLKFRIKELEGLYYLCSENKGADQLRGYREADLRLCFRICKKPVFSQRGSYFSGDVPARLVNGTMSEGGRLELFYNGSWGTVCDDLFTEQNAKVACRMLGYSGYVMNFPMKSI